MISRNGTALRTFLASLAVAALAGCAGDPLPLADPPTPSTVHTLLPSEDQGRRVGGGLHFVPYYANISSDDIGFPLRNITFLASEGHEIWSTSNLILDSGGQKVRARVADLVVGGKTPEGTLGSMSVIPEGAVSGPVAVEFDGVQTTLGYVNFDLDQHVDSNDVVVIGEYPAIVELESPVEITIHNRSQEVYTGLSIASPDAGAPVELTSSLSSSQSHTCPELRPGARCTLRAALELNSEAKGVRVFNGVITPVVRAVVTEQGHVRSANVGQLPPIAVNQVELDLSEVAWLSNRH